MRTKNQKATTRKRGIKDLKRKGVTADRAAAVKGGLLRAPGKDRTQTEDDVYIGRTRA